MAIFMQQPAPGAPTGSVLFSEYHLLGNFKVLKNLNATTDGKWPKGNLLLGSDGNFYGMTSAGGTNSAGTIFKITPAGLYSVLKHFDLVADGGTPFGGLIIDACK
jgi:uncharacterized repeat protein (TIGR03803 family)